MGKTGDVRHLVTGGGFIGSHVADALIARGGDLLVLDDSEPVAIIDLARRVLEQTESQSRVTPVPYEQACEPGFEELGHRVPDTTALSELTGWTQTRGLDETIADVVAYEPNKERATERTSAAV
jgi:nucleoside-diphosphate-sugar epimerase